MEIEYELTETDILALMQYRLQQKRGLHNPVLLRRFAYLISFALMALGIWLLLHNAIVPIIFLILGIVSFIFYPNYFDWLVRRKVSITYQNPKARTTLASRMLRATVDGLEEKASMVETRVKWEIVDNLATTPLHIFISIQGVPSMVIPVDRVGHDVCQEFVRTCCRYIKEVAS